MTDYPDPHWTDSAARPVFTTVILAVGPSRRPGNINHILAETCALLRILRVPADRIEALRAYVGTAQNYDEAIGYIERWFPVECE